MNHRRRIILTFISVVMLAVFAIGGMLAYLSGNDAVTNTMNVGNVKIELSEPNYTQVISDALVANQTISKDPQIKNTGKNDAVVFLKITIPVRNVATVKEDGSLDIEKADGSLSPKTQDVFTMCKEGGATAGRQHTYSRDWVELTAQEQISKDNGSAWVTTGEGGYDSTTGYYDDGVTLRTYLFGYNTFEKVFRKYD